MADIDVVKKGTSVWIWILLAVVLAVVLWFVLGMNRTETTTGQLHGTQPLAAGALAAWQGDANAAGWRG